MWLTDQVVIVTGAGRGLGRAYARACAAEGAAVVVNDRDAEPAEEVARAIEADGGRAVACVESVATARGASRIVASTLDEFGRLDVMVTNAGADRRGPSVELTLEDWSDTLDAHLFGSIRCSIEAARVMRDQGRGGAIVNVTSGAFFMGSATLGPYGVAKGGIYALMRVLATELWADGIAVNAVMPPLVATSQAMAWVDGLASDPSVSEAEVDAIRARAETPEAVAPLVVFLATPAGRAVTGQLFRPTRRQVAVLEMVTQRTVETDRDAWDVDALAAAIPRLVAER